MTRATIVRQNDNPELIVRINELASTTESILVTADVSQGDITSPDPAMRAFATEDLLDASPGRPGGETHAYSLEEEVQMLGALPEPAALAVAVFTGACKGEICGLLWEGYDGFSIRVKQAVWRSHVDEPKQEKS